jgi:hypothetical protein
MARQDSNEVRVGGRITDFHIRLYKRVAQRVTGEFRTHLLPRRQRRKLKAAEAFKRRCKAAARLASR